MKQPLLRKCAVCVLVLAALMAGSVLRAQEKEHPIPQLVTKDGRHALLVDGEPYMILAGQSDNSSTWPKMLPGVWRVIEEMHANTLQIPLYWEQVEPEEGKYDFSMVDLLLKQAREHEVRLILTWFGTWKNGSNHYMPAWMKLQPKKYPNVVGKDGRPVDSPSPHALATREADAKAFAALMRHLKEADPQRTVILVQVENEPGTWGSVRDYSKEAERLFGQPVPEALLQPEVLKALGVDARSEGTWSEVFGERADEYFHAWSVASYIEYVAAAGQAEYPLPMFVNVALRWPFGNPPATNYESGGPTDNVIPIWKVAAPSICLLAPDIYLQGDEPVLKVLELYARPDNALLVPETSSDRVKYLYEIVGKGIGYSPFGIDNPVKVAVRQHDAIAAEYRLLAPMARQLARWSFEGRIFTAVEREKQSESRIDLGQWEAVLQFGTGRHAGQRPDTVPRPADGKAMIVRLADNEFLAVGTHCRFSFRPVGKNAGKPWQYLRVEEGYYENGEFQMIRVLNGDQTDWGGPYIGDKPTLLRITLYTR